MNTQTHKQKLLSNTQCHTNTLKRKLAHHEHTDTYTDIHKHTHTHKHRHASQTHSLTHHDTGTIWGMKLRILVVAEDPKWPVGVKERWAAFKISPIKCLWLGGCISWFQMRSKWKYFSCSYLLQKCTKMILNVQVVFLLPISSKNICWDKLFKPLCLIWQKHSTTKQWKSLSSACPQVTKEGLKGVDESEQEQAKQMVLPAMGGTWGRGLKMINDQAPTKDQPRWQKPRTLLKAQAYY